MTRPHVPIELRRQVTADAQHRCGYCLSDETLTGIPLSIEHIVPIAAGGTTTHDNLWMACRPCNEYKNERTQAVDPLTNELAPFYNPRSQSWHDHFAWDADGTLIVGLTPSGRVTVEALQLNRLMLVRARRRWVALDLHPPKD